MMTLEISGFHVKEIDEHSLKARLAKRSTLFPLKPSRQPFAINFRKMAFRPQIFLEKQSACEVLREIFELPH